jgi:hypothetical protein
MRIRFSQVLLAAVLLAGIGTIAFIWISPFVAQDACLDSGGAWNGGHCQH